MTRILLVRHGQTEWNKTHRIQGKLDSPLNDTGRAQAEAVGKALASEDKLAAVWASDLQRAWHTAEAITKHHPHLTIKPEPRMRELSFGDWEGKYWPNLSEEERKIADQWRLDATSITIPGGESMAEFADRVRGVVTDAYEQYPEETVLIAAHGGSIKVFVAIVLELPMRMAWRLGTGNTAITELYIFPEGPYLERLNDTSHLSD